MDTSEILIALLREAVTGEAAAVSGVPDWRRVLQLARIHGVEPLLADVILRLPAEQQPDKPTVMMMKQLCLHNMQLQTYWRQCIAKAVSALRKADIEPVLLKGFGLAEHYDKPYLRSWGDADIWVGIANYHPACGIMRNTFPEAIHHDEEYEELKHYGIVFPDGKAIELHRIAMDFPTPEEDRLWQTLEVPAMQAAVNNEKCQLSIVNSQSSIVNRKSSIINCQLTIPPEPFNLLFVFLHAWEHFCGSGMPLKQLADIVLLVRDDYAALPDAEKQAFDAFLRTWIRRFHVREAWQLIAYAAWYVFGVTMPLYTPAAPTARQKLFLQTVLREGQCRVRENILGGKDRNEERERIKQLPVLQRKMLTLKGRFTHAALLRAYAPAYARHVLFATIRKGIRRTIRRERMIDY